MWSLYNNSYCSDSNNVHENILGQSTEETSINICYNNQLQNNTLDKLQLKFFLQVLELLHLSVEPVMHCVTYLLLIFNLYQQR